MASNGQAIEPGYKPDYVLRKGNDYIIMECENTSSRKTFVGALIKAAHFLVNDRKGILVLILVQKINTSDIAIAKHLKNYLGWVQDKTNLREIYVISTSNYFADGKVLKLFSRRFMTLAKKV